MHHKARRVRESEENGSFAALGMTKKGDRGPGYLRSGVTRRHDVDGWDGRSYGVHLGVTKTRDSGPVCRVATGSVGTGLGIF